VAHHCRGSEGERNGGNVSNGCIADVMATRGEGRGARSKEPWTKGLGKMGKGARRKR
jgi:hypothetical protein